MGHYYTTDGELIEMMPGVIREFRVSGSEFKVQRKNLCFCKAFNFKAANHIPDTNCNLFLWQKCKIMRCKLKNCLALVAQKWDIEGKTCEK
jgi:hypothetical protein